MDVLRTRLDGLILIAPSLASDDRGFFLETYHHARYRAAGINSNFVQDNHSRSLRGVLRGLHYQVGAGQPKLVRAARGTAFDVVVDLRRHSPTFGAWESFVLDDKRHLQLFIPPGFAHGFCTLSAELDFVYKVGSYYDPALESGIAWDDPAIGIHWPISDPIVSERDRHNPTLAAVAGSLPDWSDG